MWCCWNLLKVREKDFKTIDRDGKYIPGQVGSMLIDDFFASYITLIVDVRSDS